jgi:hypothetical protein
MELKPLSCIFFAVGLTALGGCKDAATASDVPVDPWHAEAGHMHEAHEFVVGSNEDADLRITRIGDNAFTIEIGEAGWAKIPEDKQPAIKLLLPEGPANQAQVNAVLAMVEGALHHEAPIHHEHHEDGHESEQSDNAPDKN